MSDYYSDFDLSPAQLSNLRKYQDLLLGWNKKVNLFSRQSESSLPLHLYDSLSPLLHFDFDPVEYLLDLGSGGGLPGLPLAIALPQKKVILLEATQKKTTALKDIVAQLGLPHVNILTGRAEEIGQGHLRQSIHLVVARAVAPLPTLLELALPLLKLKGFLLAFKGPDYFAELARSETALEVLGGTVRTSYRYQLPDKSFRAHLIFQKISPTPPGYPRRPGVPSHKPL